MNAKSLTKAVGGRWHGAYGDWNDALRQEVAA